MELRGVNAISGYLGLSEATTMDMILRKKFKCERNEKESIFIAESEDIDAFLAKPKPKTKAKPIVKKKESKAKAKSK